MDFWGYMKIWRLVFSKNSKDVVMVEDRESFGGYCFADGEQGRESEEAGG
jgi:hypothetical protein